MYLCIHIGKFQSTFKNVCEFYMKWFCDQLCFQCIHMILCLGKNCLYLDGCSRLIVLPYPLPANIPYILICNNKGIMIPGQQQPLVSFFSHIIFSCCLGVFRFILFCFLIPSLTPFLFCYFLLLGRLCVFPPEFLLKMKQEYDFCICLCTLTTASMTVFREQGLLCHCTHWFLKVTLALINIPHAEPPHIILLLLMACSNNLSFVFTHCQTTTF